MKKRTLFACGLAAALFAGCSSDDVTVDNGTIDPNAKSYLSLRVSLPSTSGNSSRDTSTPGNQKNDVFNSGDPDEYKVSSIDLVCFDNDDKIVDILPNISGATWTGSTNGITTEAILPAQSVASTTKKVLVLINRPTTLLINGTAPLAKGSTFADLNAALTVTKTENLTGDGYNNFFMSNAPLSDGKTAGHRTVLVNVDTKKTKELAMADAREVYVERAVGKVSMTVNNESGTHWTPATWTYKIAADEGYKDDEITIKAWKIDNYNLKTYPVRKYVEKADTWEGYVANENGQRFFGGLKYKGNYYYDPAGGTLEGRTYWAEDPNYEGKDGLQTSIDNFDDVADVATLSKPQYCLENTFNVDNMKNENTTRVVIKALYHPNGLTSGETWFRIGNTKTAYSASTLTDKINEVLGLSGADVVKLKAHGTSADQYTYAQGEQDFKEEMFAPASASNAAITAPQITTLKKALGSLTGFIDGYCYYTAFIQHFGSYYTPWGNDTNAHDWGEANGGKFYNYIDNTLTGEEEYLLGRYGVVRNNWYQLELGEVSAPGSPKVPGVDTTPDDEVKYYISTTVKIMDWAVRKQSVNL